MGARSRLSHYISLALIILLPGAIFVYIGMKSTHHFKTLEHFGPKSTEQVVRNGDTLTETVYHQVPDFRFIDCKGKERHLKELPGKVTLVEFFQKKTLLKRLSVEFRGIPSVHFLSILTDTNMSGSELRRYTDHIRVDTSRWTFARAPMNRIEQFAVEGCFKGATAPDTIRRLIRQHPVMVLLDEEHHVRGVYEGPHANEIERAIDEIRLLMKEMDKRDRTR